MKISIYQIVLERDTQHLVFRDKSIFTLACGQEFPSHLYEQVFSGDVEVQSLEDIFRMFNYEHPVDYRGRSMSVSDIVEVRSPTEGSKFFFCCPIGFDEVAFDPHKATPSCDRK